MSRYSRPRTVVTPVRPRKRSEYASHYVMPSPVVETQVIERASEPAVLLREDYRGEFEITYESVLAGGKTKTFTHPKKERVVKVLAGEGVVYLGEAHKRLVTGRDIVLPAEVSHCFEADADLQLMFVQPKSYEARLKVENTEVLPERPRPIAHRRGSKAVEQATVAAAERKRRLGVKEKAQSLGRAPRPSPDGFVAANPTFGADLPGEPG